MKTGNPTTDDLASAAARTARRAAAEIERLATAPLTSGLYLVATPIGNLADITVRALAVLAAADIVYCEDTRHSRTLLAHYAIAVPTRSYHEHNAEAERPRILERLACGGRVALISDAGTPLVSDPGHKLVRAALEAGRCVHAIPGPSAVLAALTGAGLASESFLFAGFLPSRSAARRTRLAELGAAPATLVLFEAPSRLADTLADARDVLGERPAAVARELTKLHEETVRGTLAELAARYADQPVKGEIVLLIAPSARGPVADAEIARHLAAALARTGLNDAAKTVAAALGVPKARVYDIGLGLKDAASGGTLPEDAS
jgi:16S rRNA (cytidine1402-2'-O)-methyltransferase